jgi:hypothetical protein
LSAFRIRVAGGPAFDCGANDNLVSAAERAGWQQNLLPNISFTRVQLFQTRSNLTRLNISIV